MTQRRAHLWKSSNDFTASADSFILGDMVLEYTRGELGETMEQQVESCGGV
jgi:hypothetical protein